MLRPFLPLFLLLCFASLPSCGPDVDHYKRALAIERELLRQSPDAGYGHAAYVQVMRELDQVPGGSPDHRAAEAWFARISDGRRFAVGEKIPQAAHLPDRLALAKAPQPPRPQAATAVRPAADNRPPSTVSAAPAPSKEALEKLHITLYSTSWCGYCKKAKSWFTRMGYPFVEKDVERDPAAGAEYQQKSGGYGGVPLIDLNGKVVRGFDQRTLEREIGRILGGT